MKQDNKYNRQIVLASRPHGMPSPENFQLKQVSIPDINDEQVLLRTCYLSIDPYMRSRMNDEASYAAATNVGDPMPGATICEIIKSNNPSWQEKQQVLAYSGWQDYAVSDGEDLMHIDQLKHPTYMLSILGMPGFTAYVGIVKIGEPKEDETVVVGAASGPVGSIVGQIAKLKGCYVVGIAGGEEKCSYVKETLGFDVCLDRKAKDFKQQLAKYCPKGIDIYYENVGGDLFDAVLPLLNVGARIPLCGLISQYNLTGEFDGPNQLPIVMRTLLTKRIKLQGFIISDYYKQYYKEFINQMGQWLNEDKIIIKEDVTTGLEQAPNAFIKLMQGQNFGKVIIEVAKA